MKKAEKCCCKMKDKCLNFFKTRCGCLLFISGIVLFILIIIEIFFDFTNIRVFATGDASLIILTFGIFIAASINLKGIRKIAKDDYLLRISERYGSTEIFNARFQLHAFHIEVEKNLKEKYKISEIEIHAQKEEEYNKLMSQEILNIKNDKINAKTFTEILVFLDFLETMAYLVEKDSLDKKVVPELLGSSFNYYYGIFKGYITIRRKKYKDQCKNPSSDSENSDKKYCEHLENLGKK